ncbi:hypothetical protein [Rhodoplanes roseus]|uniref:Uncharacterized protein n=1 Tax=Rhodoplanes roseus TaxID=29409 RepID=A0A327KX74_9BRAD|nr:hypothetical protein [Rhodoplanes roseus]RAI42901.1 hypothetical protein CH341_17040 [Rhodoplanes roseus]
MPETTLHLVLEKVEVPYAEGGRRPDDFIVRINERRVGRIMSSFADGAARRWYWSVDSAPGTPQDRGVALGLDEAKQAMAQRLVALTTGPRTMRPGPGASAWATASHG